MEIDKPQRQRFKRYPVGFLHLDIAEVQTSEGKLYLFVATDRKMVEGLGIHRTSPKRHSLSGTHHSGR